MATLDQLIEQLEACEAPIAIIVGDEEPSALQQLRTRRINNLVTEWARAEMDMRGLGTALEDTGGTANGSAALDFIFAQAGPWLIDALLSEVALDSARNHEQATNSMLEHLLTKRADRFSRLLTTNFSVVSSLAAIAKQRNRGRRGLYLPAALHRGVAYDAAVALAREQLHDHAILVVELSGKRNIVLDILQLHSRAPGSPPVWRCYREPRSSLVRARRPWPGAIEVFEAGPDQLYPRLVQAFVPSTPQVPERMLHGATGIELMQIPAGRFSMGSPHGRGHEDERPQHTVKLDGFYLAKTPVTNMQYARYLDTHPDVAQPRYWNDERFNRSHQPVVGVSWKDARAYCAWAGLVLPTEAQWEYACRAGTPSSQDYWSGNGKAALAEVGWFQNNSEDRLHDVAQKPANPFGLHDMHGNVWEWCLDDWVNNYRRKARAGDGLRLEPQVDSRIMRGGCWSFAANSARSAYRSGRPSNYTDANIGFRPAQPLP